MIKEGVIPLNDSKSIVLATAWDTEAKPGADAKRIVPLSTSSIRLELMATDYDAICKISSIQLFGIPFNNENTNPPATDSLMYDNFYSNQSYWKLCQSLDHNCSQVFQHNLVTANPVCQFVKKILIFSGWGHIFFPQSYRHWLEVFSNFIVFIRVSLGIWTQADYDAYSSLFFSVYPEYRDNECSDEAKFALVKFLNSILPPRAGDESCYVEIKFDIYLFN